MAHIDGETPQRREGDSLNAATGQDVAMDTPALVKREATEAEMSLYFTLVGADIARAIRTDMARHGELQTFSARTTFIRESFRSLSADELNQRTWADPYTTNLCSVVAQPFNEEVVNLLRDSFLNTFNGLVKDEEQAKNGTWYLLDALVAASYACAMKELAPELERSKLELDSSKVAAGFLGTLDEVLAAERPKGKKEQILCCRKFVDALNPNNIDSLLPDYAAEAVHELCRGGKGEEMMEVIKGYGHAIVDALEATGTRKESIRDAIDILAPHVFIRSGLKPVHRPKPGASSRIDLDTLRRIMLA
jgi:hypothetical protein